MVGERSLGDIRKEVGNEFENLLKEFDKHKTAARFASKAGGPEAYEVEQMLEKLSELQKEHEESGSPDEEVSRRLERLEKKLDNLQRLEGKTGEEEKMEDGGSSTPGGYSGSSGSGSGSSDDVGVLREKLSKAHETYESHHSKLKMFALALLHWLMMGSQMDVVGGIFLFVISAFILLAGSSFFAIRTKDRGIFGAFALDAGGAYALPYLIDLLPETVSFARTLRVILVLVWFVTPVVGLYIARYSGWHGYTEAWGISLVIIGLLAVALVLEDIVQLIVPGFGGGADLADTISDIPDFFGESVATIWGLLEKAATATKSGTTRALDYATGGYYTSQVERQQGEPVGLYIDNLRASSETYFEGEEIFLWADIGGKSFQEEIEIHTGCSTENVEGNTTPEDFTVFVQGGEAVQCRFSSLPPEEHTIDFSASFDFETWGYVTYTFVDQQTKRNILSQGKDINKELEVQSSLRPVYTPGPVAIEMLADIPQPVGISPDRGLNTAFGFRLNKRWTDGELQRVREFVVLTPPQFKLTSCDAPYEEFSQDPMCAENPDVCAEDMRAYKFPNKKAKKFSSIGCRLELANPGTGLDELLPPGQQKVQKTFVVKAKYDYRMEESEKVEVRESAG